MVRNRFGARPPDGAVRRPTVAIGLAALVVLSGCSAPTVSLDDVDRPPGVREDYVDPEPLVAAHAAALEQESYTATFTIQLPNRSLRGVLRVGPNHDFATFDLTRNRPEGMVTIHYYITPNHVYQFTESDSEPITDVRPSNPDEIRHLRRQVGLVAAVQTAARTTGLRPRGVVGSQGKTLVVLATNATEASPPYASEHPLEVRMLVSERGVVHSLTFTHPSDEVRMTWTLQDVGQTRVAEPAWVDQYVENSTE